jgi:hypothetical protein
MRCEIAGRNLATTVDTVDMEAPNSATCSKRLAGCVDFHGAWWAALHGAARPGRLSGAAARRAAVEDAGGGRTFVTMSRCTSTIC